MEMRPPCVHRRVSIVIVTIAITSTYDIVVLAADHVSSARVSRADANDGDGRAVDPEEDVDAVHHNAEQAEEKVSDGVGGLRRGTCRSVVAHREVINKGPPWW